MPVTACGKRQATRQTTAPNTRSAQLVRLAHTLDSGADTVVLLAVSQTCPHCIASLPFYQQLSTAVKRTGGKVKLLAVFPTSGGDPAAFLQKRSLDPRNSR